MSTSEMIAEAVSVIVQSKPIQNFGGISRVSFGCFDLNHLTALGMRLNHVKVWNKTASSEMMFKVITIGFCIN